MRDERRRVRLDRGQADALEIGQRRRQLIDLAERQARELVLLGGAEMLIVVVVEPLLDVPADAIGADAIE